MTCRKSLWRAVSREGGGVTLLRVKCRSEIDDNGRCVRCGGRYGRRSSKAAPEILRERTIKPVDEPAAVQYRAATEETKMSRLEDDYLPSKMAREAIAEALHDLRTWMQESYGGTDAHQRVVAALALMDEWMEERGVTFEDLKP